MMCHHPHLPCCCTQCLEPLPLPYAVQAPAACTDESCSLQLRLRRAIGLAQQRVMVPYSVELDTLIGRLTGAYLL